MRYSTKSSNFFTIPKKYQDFLLDLFILAQAIMLGFVWGEINWAMFVESVTALSLLPYLPWLQPLFYLSQFTLPLFITLSIIQTLLVKNVRMPELKADFFLWVARIYTYIRAFLTVTSFAFFNDRKTNHSLGYQQTWFIASLFTFGSAYETLHVAPVKNKRTRFNISTELKDILWAIINMAGTIPPIYQFVKAVTSKATWKIIQYPIMLLLFIAGLLTQAKKNTTSMPSKNTNNFNQPKNSWVHTLWYGLAAASAMTQTVVFSHLLTVMLLHSPLLFYLTQIQMIKPFLYPVIRAFTAYCFHTEETGLIYDGAHVAATKSCELFDTLNDALYNFLPNSTDRHSGISYSPKQ